MTPAGKFKWLGNLAGRASGYVFWLVGLCLSALAAAEGAGQSAQGIHSAAEDKAWRPLQIYDPATLPDIRLVEPVEKAEAFTGGGWPLQIGVARPVPEEHQGNLLPKLHWQFASNGRQTAAFRVTSPGAHSLRAGLAGHLPAGARVRFFGLDDSAPTYPALARLPQEGVASLIAPEAPSVFADPGMAPVWSPIVAGDSMGVEISLPLDATPADFSLAVTRVSHLHGAEAAGPSAHQQPANHDSGCANEPLTLACATDAPADVANMADATVRLRFTERDGGTFVCSAALIRDARSDAARRQNAYLLTAAHCVRTQAVADTVDVTFGHQAAVCEGVASSGVTLFDGTDLMVAHRRTDNSLLRLKQAVPAGQDVHWLRWSEDQAVQGQPFTGVHQPGGGPKEYMAGMSSRNLSVLSDASVIPTLALAVDVTSGHVRGGSSGSAGVMGMRQEIVGSLSGVSETPGECLAFYGRMDRADAITGLLLRAGNTSPVTPAADDHVDEHGPDATGVMPNSEISAMLSHEDDVDVFSVRLTEAGALTVWTEGSLDTIGLLRDCNGEVVSNVGTDDDAGDGKNFRISELLITTACSTWFIEVASYDGGTGAYELNVEFESSASVSERRRARAYAIPPISVQDWSSVRIRCDSAQTACSVRLECADQGGNLLSGAISDPIAPNSVYETSTEAIGEILGVERWDRRLACEARSAEPVSVQIWTRSGNGVLVNNTAIQDSVLVGGRHVLRAWSIPSPQESDATNFRIRCEANTDCRNLRLECHDDNGQVHTGVLDDVPAHATRHMLADALATAINHSWTGMGLSCAIESSEPLSLQLLTRTGPGTGVDRALVNNTALSWTSGSAQASEPAPLKARALRISQKPADPPR